MEAAAVAPAMVGRPRVKPANQQPWDQQSGENDLWYARFLRYVALGPTRSVSLVARGRRNAYPIPAHWPIQAKQQNWKARAENFDAAAKADPAAVDRFNLRLGALRVNADRKINGEAELLVGVAYQAPSPDDDLT